MPDEMVFLKIVSGKSIAHNRPDASQVSALPGLLVRFALHVQFFGCDQNQPCCFSRFPVSARIRSDGLKIWADQQSVATLEVGSELCRTDSMGWDLQRDDRLFCLVVDSPDVLNVEFLHAASQIDAFVAEGRLESIDGAAFQDFEFRSYRLW